MTSFCVRTNDFESIIETVQESTGNSNPHLIVVGPRGSGKTHLSLRVAVEIRSNSELRRLVQREAVTVEGGTARRMQYNLTERQININYLLRRGAGASSTLETEMALA